VLTLEQFPPAFLVTFAVALGLVLGSFLNVVIYRLPLGLSVVSPGSACPGCGRPIRAFDNIPVLSWLVLRGKARCCGVKISPRYPLVELRGGLMAWALVTLLLAREPGTTPWTIATLLFLIHLGFGLALLAAIFIDFEYMIVPNEITFGLTIVGLLSAPLREVSLLSALIGTIAGFMVIWLPFIWLYPLIRGHAGMGLGDAKLLMAVGAWFGFSGALFSLLGGAVQGTLFALVVFLVRGRLEEPEAVTREREALRAELQTLDAETRAELEAEIAKDPLASEPKEGLGKARVAFGPFLSLAALEFLFLGDWLNDYLRWMWP
jgi:leader peptidase (prepilin peptidase)/N-methyltransferase